jgi:Mor family transcriptional regulator
MKDEQTRERIPKQYRDFVRLIGLEATVRLLSEYGGDYVYMPTLQGLKAAKRRIEILKEFDGTNAEELARKHGVTVRYVQILARDKK